MSASIERRIAVPALAIAVLASCTPILREDLGNGDHAVTTYVRLFGAEGARINNERLAEQTCPDGIIRMNEGFGMDADGYYRRLEYGCLAP
jgi:hypothetical protein